MDFGYTPEQEAFRKEVREFIKSKLPAGWSQKYWRYAFDFYSHTHIAGPTTRMMAKELGSKGWLSIPWPKEYGGQGGSYIDHLIVAEELAAQHAPGIEIFGNLISDVILEFGTEEQKKQHLPGIRNGTSFWCEALSEPDAGSDLASLKTVAQDKDSGYAINGQKVWTSAAHTVDWAYVLARTDPNVPKHRGLSVFMVNLKTPGITVRPLVNANGDHGFNEVFFDDVIVPKENMLGEKNNGWNVTLRLLDFERVVVIPWYTEAQCYLNDLTEYIRQNGCENPALRLRISRLLAECEAARLLVYQASLLADKKQNFSNEAAMAKVFNLELNQRAAVLGMEILGAKGIIVEGSPRAVMDGRAAWLYIRALGNSLEMGTSEIDRNILALRGLGLPR